MLRCDPKSSTQVKGYPANPKTIGEAIRKRRLDLELRQIDVAKIIGCNELTVVNWERGHRTPRIEHMANIVQFLGHNPLPGGGTIAEKILAHRKSNGLTQEEFARQVGVDPSTLARWERGEREPKGEFRTLLPFISKPSILSKLLPQSFCVSGLNSVCGCPKYQA